MKIGILGYKGCSTVTTVAKILAERLDLEVVILQDPEKVTSTDDIVCCDSYCADAFCDVTFGLHTSIVADEISAATEYEKRKEDSVFDKAALLNQSVFMDVTLCDAEFIANEIVRILREGSYGFYVNPLLVFPSDVNNITWESTWKEGNYSIRDPTVLMCGDCYRLTGDDVEAYSCLRRHTLMKVNIVKEVFDIPTLEELEKCGKILHQDFTWAVKFYEMLLYSVKFGFEDVEAGYVNAFQNAAKPWERVHALGIQVL